MEQARASFPAATCVRLVDREFPLVEIKCRAGNIFLVVLCARAGDDGGDAQGAPVPVCAANVPAALDLDGQQQVYPGTAQVGERSVLAGHVLWTTTARDCLLLCLKQTTYQTITTLRNERM